MSEEADQLVEAFDDAVVLTATTDVMDREDFKVAHDKWSASRAALLAYIERIELERDDLMRKWGIETDESLTECVERNIDGWKPRALKAESELDEARGQLDACETHLRQVQRSADESAAEVERLRPNAERYAWLRDWRIRRDGEQFEVRRFEEGLIGRPGKWYYPSGEILDAAIDAARKAGEQS